MVKIVGHEVDFPEGKTPFPAQMAVMSKALTALTRGQNGLLESPTGTGKTLALLTSALTWQQKEFEEAVASRRAAAAQAAEAAEDMEQDHGDEGDMSKGTKKRVRSHNKVADGGEENATDPNKDKDKGRGRGEGRAPRAKAPTKKKIIFTSRTHSQLQQVVGELRNCSETYTNGLVMCVLGSRSHLCTNQSLRQRVREGRVAWEEGCRELCKRNACSQQMGMFRVRDKLAGEIWDVEDAVRAGEKVHGCSYYGSRELFQEASLILCPYNYVLDANIRSALSIDIEDSVVIFDEAHNLEDTCRTSASLSYAHSALDMACDQLSELAESGMPAFVALRDLLVSLKAWFDKTWSVLSPEDCRRGSNVWRGEEVLDLFVHELRLTPDTLPIYTEHLKTIVSDDDTANLFAKDGGGGAQGSGLTPPRKKKDASGGVQLRYEDEEEAHSSSSAKDNTDAEVGISASTRCILERLLLVYRYVLQSPEDFRLVLDEARSGSGDKPTRGRRTSRGSYVRETEPSLHIWCLNAAVAFREVAATTRSVLLASGTLSPLDSFAGELGVEFPVRVEASHVIDVKSQVFAAVVNSCNQVSLDARYANQQSEIYQDAVAATVLTASALTPGGLLCFLPSYGLMDRLLQRWEHAGQLETLKRAGVPYFVEPKAAADLEVVMSGFYRAVDGRGTRPGDGWGTGKAILFAVARGKISEGIDFSDRYARCVVMIGIPFSSTQDAQVVLKRDHQDVLSKRDPRLVSGSVWYTQQAFRAINQSIGRCIRHLKDFGAILLCDPRFQEDRSVRQLSKWMRGIVQRYNAMEHVLIPLRSFFAEQDQLFQGAVQRGELSVKVKSVTVEVTDQGKDKEKDKENKGGRRKKEPALLQGQLTLSASFRNAKAAPHAEHKPPSEYRIPGGDGDKECADAENKKGAWVAGDAVAVRTVSERSPTQQQHIQYHGGGVKEVEIDVGDTDDVVQVRSQLDDADEGAEEGTEMDDCMVWGEGHVREEDRRGDVVHVGTTQDLVREHDRIDEVPCTAVHCCCASLLYDAYKLQALRELGCYWRIDHVTLGVIPKSLSLLQAAFGHDSLVGDAVLEEAVAGEGHVIDIEACSRFLDESMTSVAASRVGMEVEMSWVPNDGVFYRALLLRTGPRPADRRVVAVKCLATNQAAHAYTERGWLLPCILRAMTGRTEPPPPSQELEAAREEAGGVERMSVEDEAVMESVFRSASQFYASIGAGRT